MKVLIIEDEDLAASRLSKLLTEIDPEIAISGPVDSVDEAVKILQKGAAFDLLLLDIQLADGKSFSIFDKVNITTPVIFTTAYDEFALKAFELNSIDYLLKPINIDKLHTALDKYRQVSDFFVQNNGNKNLYEMIKSLHTSADKNYKSRFLVNKGEALVPVSVSDIAYFFADDKYVFMTTTNKTQHVVNFTLEELEHKLDPSIFFRINRQFLVAANAIEKIHSYFNYKLKLDLNPKPKDDVIVSRNRNAEFKAWLNDEKSS